MRFGTISITLLALVVVSGCETPRSLVQLRIHMAQETESPGLVRIGNPAYREPTSARMRRIERYIKPDKYFYMYPEAVLTQDDIVRAGVTEMSKKALVRAGPGLATLEDVKETTYPAVAFKLTWSGARLFSSW